MHISAQKLMCIVNILMRTYEHVPLKQPPQQSARVGSSCSIRCSGRLVHSKEMLLSKKQKSDGAKSLEWRHARPTEAHAQEGFASRPQPEASWTNVR